MLDEAIALHRKGQHAKAAAIYRRVLAQEPDNADALNLLGLIEFQEKNAQTALALIDRAIEINSGIAAYHANRGVVLRVLNRVDEALAACDRALALKPGHPDAHFNRGLILYDLRRFAEAVASYDGVLAVRPDHADALACRGHALLALKRFDEAIASYDRSLAVKPDVADVLNSRGDVQRKLKRFEEAIASYDRVLALKPDFPFVPGVSLFCKLSVCAWDGLDRDISELARKIDAGERASPPFTTLVLPLSAARQKVCAEIVIRYKYTENPLLPPLGRYQHDRIRLGYFSADYRSHPVAILTAGLFQHHDRSSFELTAFSLGSSRRDPMRARLEKSFDRFIEVGALADRDIATLARRHEIDIAIDLTGFTEDSRPGVFALRAAPIQVNYLGYPGTMGASYIDYLIADEIGIPPSEQFHYAEKIAYLPNTYQVNDSRRRISDRLFTRAECGLPERGFVFCCFNTSHKILPVIFDVWMRVLRGVSGSVLWLLADDPRATEHLRAEATARGIDPMRLVFAKRMPPAEHLARHRLADLFLDTLPYNAHTTASDALWAGLPMLTCLGDTFPGRVGASLLHAVGLPELVTTDLTSYEALALKLATDPKTLLSLKRKLEANRLTQPLFDTARTTRDIEAVYRAMWRRHQAGLAPDHIFVRRGVDPI